MAEVTAAQAILPLAATAADSLTADSIATDTTAVHAVPALVWPPADDTPAAKKFPDPGTSWILLLLLAIFCLIGIRMRSNARYFRTLISDLTEVRERHNVFDDTVRETSFRILLVILCAGTAGVALYYAVSLRLGYMPAPEWACQIGCIAVAGLNSLVMGLLLRGVAATFSGNQAAAAWVSAFWASQAMLGMLLFPAALLLLVSPELAEPVTVYSAVTLILVKIIFIFKGFRIFFNRFSSLVSFLCYLCALEIVPLILTYAAALETTRLIAAHLGV